MNERSPSTAFRWIALVVVVVVAAVIVATIFLPPLGRAASPYAGSRECASCHAKEFEAWSNSHHRRALLPPSDAIGALAFSTVPGSTDAGRSTLTAEGPDGRTQPFAVQALIGVDPLFQCLVQFDGGRLQATALAFDVHKHEWFDLHAPEPRRPDEWGHWTQRGMTWNFQCAYCHVTDYRKNYDLAKDAYASAQLEDGVGCEACHGPLRDHVGRAKRKEDATIRYPARDETPRQHAPREAIEGVLDDWSPSSRNVPDARIETCAACHSRRRQLAEGFRPELGLQSPGNTLFDFFDPEILEGESYFADGQILEEDYEWGSFVQSRMYARGVGCSDCHDVHSGKTKKPGNALCLQCHQPALDTPAHTMHAAGTPGALCTSCHMPQTTYMLRHPRHDHSMSTPLPSLTVELGIPNACNRCHADKDAAWAVAAFDAHYGKKDRPAIRFAETIAAAREGKDAAAPDLLRLLRDPGMSAIRRATAAGLLEPWTNRDDVAGALVAALADREPLVRAHAARGLSSRARVFVPALAPLLRDPVRLVRDATSSTLNGAPLSGADRVAFDKAFDEWVDVARFNADHPGGRHDLALAFLVKGDAPAAERELRAALKLDARAVPARLDLAELLATAGHGNDAAPLLEEGVRLSPDVAELHAALGLLYARLGRREDARQS
ncbi:MAG: hypothetical protein HY292_05855, partial [Planctomycetes bacterium]|nr:hypothetical protein [Planctomycetota bacterium]